MRFTLNDRISAQLALVDRIFVLVARCALIMGRQNVRIEVTLQAVGDRVVSAQETQF